MEINVITAKYNAEELRRLLDPHNRGTLAVIGGDNPTHLVIIVGDDFSKIKVIKTLQHIGVSIL